MSLKILLHLIILSFAFIGNAIADTSLSKEQELIKAINELKSPPSDFNYLKFRKLYTDTKHYKPYTSGELEIKQKVNGSINKKEFSQCVAFADKWLNINYTNIEAHFDKYMCCKQLNDNTCASLHNSIVNGLLDSIFESGDGKTPETAYVTFNTDEIYFFLYANRLKRTKQRMLNKHGRAYDVIDAEHSKSGNTYTIYFDITTQLSNKNDDI